MSVWVKVAVGDRVHMVIVVPSSFADVSPVDAAGAALWHAANSTVALARMASVAPDLRWDRSCARDREKRIISPRVKDGAVLRVWRERNSFRSPGAQQADRTGPPRTD